MVQNRILKNKVILCEGVDAQYFLLHYLSHSQREDTQIFDFGGINQLSQYLGVFKKLEGFSTVTSLVVARDSETDASGATDSVNHALLSHGFIPQAIVPYQWHRATLSVSFVLFPGQGASGTLEDMCFEMIPEQNRRTTIQGFIDEFERLHHPLTRKHKNRLHAYFSFDNDTVGMKLGEAAKTNLFDYDNPNFGPIRSVLEAM